MKSQEHPIGKRIFKKGGIIMATYTICEKCGHEVELLGDKELGCEYCLEIDEDAVYEEERESK